MSKLVMPKNSADLYEMKSVLQVYYENRDWIDNESYTKSIKKLIGDDQYPSSYTKKIQIPAYFGFIEPKTNTRKNDKRITKQGIDFYEALLNNDENMIVDILMNSLEQTVFGRNNMGAFESDSDVEPPNVFIRASLDLGYLTNKEFAYFLYKLEDVGGNYTDVKREIERIREYSDSDNNFVDEEDIIEVDNRDNVTDENPTYEIDDEELDSSSLNSDEKVNLIENVKEFNELNVKYLDAKPITILERWGFLSSEKISRVNHYKVKQSVLEKYKKRLQNLKIYNIDREIHDNEDMPDLSSSRVIGAENILLYGVPGSGKSYFIQNEYASDQTKIERVVFYKEYQNVDFIGQITPTMSDNRIVYDFSPGPFTRIMKKAYEDPKNHYYLIIEEINRGDASAIFGEVFQLLDRDANGTSEYSISNQVLAKAIYNDKDRLVSIPSNLYLLATMNTADQNVTTLDTAFQRRWSMRMIQNNVSKASHANEEILDTEVNWAQFNKLINEIILESNTITLSSEDKRLGAYFITGDLLESDRTNMIEDNFTSLFAEKVLKYLWDDAFKGRREILFDSSFNSLEEVIDTFSSNIKIDRFNVFNTNIKEIILSIIDM